jgi:hypothetical protein
MCFHVQKGNVRPKIAEKDITCYKVFDNDAKYGNQYGTFIRSLYQFFSYKVGIKYELDGYINPIKDLHTNNSIIEVGLHSYTCLKHAKEKSIRLSWFSGYCCVYKCIIPKGSTYYVNTKHKEYVSDQIIVKELVK